MICVGGKDGVWSRTTEDRALHSGERKVRIRAPLLRILGTLIVIALACHRDGSVLVDEVGCV